MDKQLHLDESIIKHAMYLTGIKNTQEIVDFALRELIAKKEKEQLAALTETQANTATSLTAYEIYAKLDLGIGGYSPVPSNQAKAGLKTILQRKMNK